VVRVAPRVVDFPPFSVGGHSAVSCKVDGWDLLGIVDLRHFLGGTCAAAGWRRRTSAVNTGPAATISRALTRRACALAANTGLAAGTVGIDCAPRRAARVVLVNSVTNG
jgi:hypothetical protein